MNKKPRKLKIGVLLSNTMEFNGVKKKMLSLALGNNKNKDPKYDLHVELTVKDNTGKVLYTQTDGYINLSDPRTEPDDLLKAGFIDETRHEEMKARVANLSEKVRYSIEVKTT